MNRVAKGAALFLVLRAAALVPTTTISRQSLQLPSGQQIEWLSASALHESGVQPVVFVHGTFHSAWCWEPWMARFAATHGIEAHAISLRGTECSPCADARIRLSTHADDLIAAIRVRFGENQRVSLVAHSFGGPVAWEVVRRERSELVASVALVCSVPPTGNTAMTVRTVLRSPRDAWSITRAFALKTACRDVADARKVFFGPRVADDDANRYVERFERDSKSGLDLSDFNRKLPPRDASGRAAWLSDGRRNPPALVCGCERDFVVDALGVRETADFFAVEPVLFASAPHDVMLCPETSTAACDRIATWLLEAAERR